MLIKYLSILIYFLLFFVVRSSSSIAKKAIVEPRSFNITYLIKKIKFVQQTEKISYYKEEHRTIEISGKLDITDRKPTESAYQIAIDYSDKYDEKYTCSHDIKWTTIKYLDGKTTIEESSYYLILSGFNLCIKRTIDDGVFLK